MFIVRCDFGWLVFFNCGEEMTTSTIYYRELVQVIDLVSQLQSDEINLTTRKLSDKICLRFLAGLKL